MTERNYARYIVLNNRGREIDCGITRREISVRERERRREHGNSQLRLQKVGPRVTKQTALAWEADRTCSPHDPRKTRLKQR